MRSKGYLRGMEKEPNQEKINCDGTKKKEVRREEGLVFCRKPSKNEDNNAKGKERIK